MPRSAVDGGLESFVGIFSRWESSRARVALSSDGIARLMLQCYEDSCIGLRGSIGWRFMLDYFGNFRCLENRDTEERTMLPCNVKMKFNYNETVLQPDRWILVLQFLFSYFSPSWLNREILNFWFPIVNSTKTALRLKSVSIQGRCNSRLLMELILSLSECTVRHVYVFF